MTITIAAEATASTGRGTSGPNHRSATCRTANEPQPRTRRAASEEVTKRVWAPCDMDVLRAGAVPE